MHTQNVDRTDSQEPFSCGVWIGRVTQRSTSNPQMSLKEKNLAIHKQYEDKGPSTQTVSEQSSSLTETNLMAQNQVQKEQDAVERSCDEKELSLLVRIKAIVPQGCHPRADVKCRQVQKWKLGFEAVMTSFALG